MNLTNNSKYKIFNNEHTIRNDLIFKNLIPMTDNIILEELYMVIKYTTLFLDCHNIDYCIESGTLIGCVRHDGIIPWDNDLDIMIFKDGYFKLKTLMNEYNKGNFKILHVTPGFKLFYRDLCYGELFVYDLDEKINLYKMAYPYINHSNDYNEDSLEPTFICSDIHYPNQKYKKEDLFPTQIVSFEDFKVRAPNNIKNVLLITYKSNLLECVYSPDKNNQHQLLKYNHYKIAIFIEKITLNKFLLFIYIFINWLISKQIIDIF
jgi:phosphorylcholine metabolism protein LicD